MIEGLKKYWKLILGIFIFSVLTNGLSLYFPKKVGNYIDAYTNGTYSMHATIIALGSLTFVILVSAFIQFIISAYASEKIAKDYRERLITSLKKQSFRFVRETTSAKLITVMTSDVDAVKNLIASGLVSILTAGITLIAAVIFLLSINLKLGLITLSIFPVLLFVFYSIFSRVGILFGKAQMNIDRINKIINESIIASSLIRILNAKKEEISKFNEVNEIGTSIGRKILIFFASLIPIITILSNAAILMILYFGGKQVVEGTLTLGQLSAFFSYTSVFVWPFFVLSFAGTFISRAQVSFGRINEVLEAGKLISDEHISVDGSKMMTDSNRALKGNITFKDVTLMYGEKIILKDISFSIKEGTKTAIVGPTGGGKTELFYLMAGLSNPSRGTILIDGVPAREWNQSNLLSQMGLVFQDSIIFNTTIKENILLEDSVKKQNSSVDTETYFKNAVNVAELQDLIGKLGNSEQTIISERGTSLSGGQKQRVMLARALSTNPTVLLLDDFTARVDIATEKKIISNLDETYPHLTLISITQKIDPIKHYDHIIVLMEGELVAEGIHDELIKTSLEYQQIYASQKSTDSDQVHLASEKIYE